MDLGSTLLQAKVQALGARLALEWESPREQVGPGAFMDWRQDGRDGARLAVRRGLVTTGLGPLP